MLGASVKEFRVKSALEIPAVTQVASLAQPAVAKTCPLRLHTEPDAEALRARWAGFYEQAALWGRPEAIAIFEMRNALILGRSSIIMAEDGSVPRESIQKASKLNALRAQFLDSEVDVGRVLAGLDRPQFVMNDHAVLEGAYSVFTPALIDNFYHWTVEALPRLSLVEQFAPGMTPVVPPLGQPFHASSLAAMNVPPASFLQNDEIIQVERLVFSSPLARSNLAFAPLVRSFYEAFRRNLPEKPPQGRRIYISRAKSRMRRLVNEDDIFPIAAEMGFERCFLEEMSFSEQAALFAQADIVVGPHGAGFGNTVHCRPGTAMVELLHDEFREGMTSFWALANMFELDHHLLLGPARNINRRIPANSDFSVDAGLFRTMLGGIVAERGPSGMR